MKWGYTCLILIFVSAYGFLFYDSHSGSESISIPKTRCVEICTETLMKRGVFPPDFHDTVQQCDEMFAHRDTCELRSK